VNATSNIDQRMGVLSIGRKNMFGKQKKLRDKKRKMAKNEAICIREIFLIFKYDLMKTNFNEPLPCLPFG